MVNSGRETWASSRSRICNLFLAASSVSIVSSGSFALLPSRRIQISARRYRIADVCILRSSDPQDAIIRVALLLCIEILSKGDSLSELQERVDDYQSMGIENIWAIDPWKRHGYIASTRGFEQPQDGILAIPDSPIRVSLAEVFAEFDEIL